MILQTNVQINKIPDYLLVLKQEREKLNITQNKLAYDLGISPQLLSHYETGKREPKINFIEKWCDKLGFEVYMELNKKPF